MVEVRRDRLDGRPRRPRPGAGRPPDQLTAGVPVTGRAPARAAGRRWSPAAGRPASRVRPAAPRWRRGPRCSRRTRSGTTGPTTTGPSPKCSATAAPALSGLSTPPSTTTSRSPCTAHSASSPTCRAERRTSSMSDSRARPPPRRGHPAQHHHDVALVTPSRARSPATGSVSSASARSTRVDDQRLEPGVPGAAHLRGPGVDLGGGERDLAGVAHDRVAHRGRVVVARRPRRRSPRPPRWSAGPSRRFGGGSQRRSKRAEPLRTPRR